MSLQHPSFQVALCFSFLLLAAGCSKTNSSLSTNGTLSATAGGAAFNATQVGGVYSRSLGFMAVLGYSIHSNDTTGFQLQFAYVPPVGITFSSDSTPTGLTYFIPGRRYDAFLGQGKVLVNLSVADTVNHKLAGSFSGTVYNDAILTDSVVITNGKFSSTYSVQP
jgi:hypothetical protein